LRLTQSLTVVVPASATWSLWDARGPDGARRPCPLARSSTVTLDLADAPIGTMIVRDGSTSTPSDDGRVVRYDLWGGRKTPAESVDRDHDNITICDAQPDTLHFALRFPLPERVVGGTSTPQNPVPKATDQPPFTVDAAVLALGRAGGTIATVVHSRLDTAADLTLTFTLPWQLRVYTHTLRARGATVVSPDSNNDDGSRGGGDDGGGVGGGGASVWTSVYTPARDGVSLGLWELSLALPSPSPRGRRDNDTQTEIEIRFDFVPAFQHMSDFQPDPNRGIPVPAVVLSGSWRVDDGGASVRGSGGVGGGVGSDGGGGSGGGGGGAHREHARVYSDQLSVLLPHPDFSMPFNVIALTSTVLAGAFGLWIQLATRPFVDDERDGAVVSSSPLSKGSTT
jgi:hypothetical protein